MTKQMLFLTIIFNSIVTSGFAMEETPTNPYNRILNRGWWNEINGKYFTDVFFNFIDPQDKINKLPLVIKNRQGKLELAGTLGEHRSQKSDPKSTDFPHETKALLDAIHNNYGVVCDDRFLIVYSDQVSDCEKVLIQLRNELKDTEEGLEFFRNRHQQLTDFFDATMNDDNNEKNPE